MIKLAFYGKGGIGKSTAASNVSVALAQKGLKVMQIGCDPKADSTIFLHGGERIPTVLDLVRKGESFDLEDMVRVGYNDVVCVEAGGPVPGLGCAGRGIIAALEELEKRAHMKNISLTLLSMTFSATWCAEVFQCQCERAMPIRCLSSHQARVCLYMPPQTSQWRWKISKAVDMLLLAVLSLINAT